MTIKVPQEMRTAALRAAALKTNTTCIATMSAQVADGAEAGLEAALLWLSENPIVPGEEWVANTMLNEQMNTKGGLRAVIAEWQRRMFAAPEPKVPAPIRDLLWNSENQVVVRGRTFDQAVTEAYRRGQRNPH